MIIEATYSVPRNIAEYCPQGKKEFPEKHKSFTTTYGATSHMLNSKYSANKKNILHGK